ncbi:MAG: hypothetical protein IKS25_00490 [Oscillospiraceae bacterium]|nr:hypothetical protein [Oscillospiraceae bacterium]
MRIDQLPDLPSGVDQVKVPCSHNGADFALPLDSDGYSPPYTIGFVDDPSARADFQLSAGGYAYIAPPSGFPSGAKVLRVGAIVWTSSNGISFTEYGSNAAYVIGPGGATVTGLKCRWWYYKEAAT